MLKNIFENLRRCSLLNPFLLANIVFNGIPLKFYTHEEDIVIGHILRQGIVFEAQELNYLSSIIKSDSKVLDAGANIGLMSIPLAKIEPSATIYCFEPDPLNYALLNLNIVINNIHNILTFNYALGKEQKFVAFYKNNANHGDHRTSKPLINDIDEGNFSSFSHRVHMVNIVEFMNQCLGEQAPKYFDVLKIDTQGDDFNILESCLPLINEHSTVIMEYSPYHLLRSGTRKEQISNILDHFSNIGVINRNQQDVIIINVDKEKIVTDFDLISPTPIYYDITLKGKI